MCNAGLSFSQVEKNLIKNFYTKIYNLKTKGVNDLVVDVESSKLLREINELKVFGIINQLTFRVYWTLSPERVTVDILGLPEGFYELKDKLRLSFLPVLEEILPLEFERKFTHFVESPAKVKNTVYLKDSKGINPIQGYWFKFTDEGNLTEIEFQKPVGETRIYPKYKKTSFSEGRWAIEQEKTVINEGDYIITTTKDYSYNSENGISFIGSIESVVESENKSKKIDTMKIKDKIYFKNYKINQGEALKYFLSEFKRNKAE
jgi:hypothetical protein